MMALKFISVSQAHLINKYRNIKGISLKIYILIVNEFCNYLMMVTALNCTERKEHSVFLLVGRF